MAILGVPPRKKKPTYARNVQQRTLTPNAPFAAGPPTPAPPGSPGGGPVHPTAPNNPASGPPLGPAGGLAPNNPTTAIGPAHPGPPGSPGGPPAGTPAAPPHPAGVPFPLDPAYTQQVGAAQQELNVTQAGLAYQRQRAVQEYGFDDPSDPYNRAAQLERTFHQSQAGTLNSGASRGQLYSGATQSNLDEGGYQYQRQRTGLRREYDDLLHQLLQQSQQAQAGYRTTVASAAGDALSRQLQNRPEDPGLPQGRDTGKGYARLDEIRGFLKKHPDLKTKDPNRYKRLINEAQGLKGWLPPRH